MAGAQTYQDLLIRQKGMDLCEACYRFAARLPNEELYGLISQIRRASVSRPATIAEGFARELKGSFTQQLRIGQGSLKDLETHLTVCRRVGLTTREQVDRLLSLADELGRKVRSLIRSLQD